MKFIAALVALCITAVHVTASPTKRDADATMSSFSPPPVLIIF
jgi:hypothetical protein